MVSQTNQRPDEVLSWIFDLQYGSLTIEGLEMVKMTVDAINGVNINRGQRPITGVPASLVFALVTF